MDLIPEVFTKLEFNNFWNDSLKMCAKISFNYHQIWKLRSVTYEFPASIFLSILQTCQNLTFGPKLRSDQKSEDNKTVKRKTIRPPIRLFVLKCYIK